MMVYPELLIQPDGSLNHESFPILARVLNAKRQMRVAS